MTDTLGWVGTLVGREVWSLLLLGSAVSLTSIPASPKAQVMALSRLAAFSVAVRPVWAEVEPAQKLPRFTPGVFKAVLATNLAAFFDLRLLSLALNSGSVSWPGSTSRKSLSTPMPLARSGVVAVAIGVAGTVRAASISACLFLPGPPLFLSAAGGAREWCCVRAATLVATSVGSMWTVPAAEEGRTKKGGGGFETSGTLAKPRRTSSSSSVSPLLDSGASLPGPSSSEELALCPGPGQPSSEDV